MTFRAVVSDSMLDDEATSGSDRLVLKDTYQLVAAISKSFAF